MAKITVDNVSYVYSAGTPFEVRALDDVCIEIKENTVTGIIGHTGSGKSTLVQMFNGLVKPSSGRILLDGEDIWAKPREIGKITPSALARGCSRLMSGRPLPVSHLETVLLLTPSCSARSPWVIFRFSRRALIAPPVT